jgi:cold shock CspA family protein
MGFSIFWRLFDEDRLEEDAKPKIHDSVKVHWLVIDYNNLVMSIFDGSGGHVYLIEKRCTFIFNAIKNSGYRIHIFKDGNINEERAVIKLKRQHADMMKNVGLNITNKGSDTKSCMKIARKIASRIFKADEQIQITKADGEADPAIRLFISALPSDERATIISGDASLILGLSSSVSIVDGRSFSVDPRTNCLKWRPILVKIFLEKLNTATGEEEGGGPTGHAHVIKSLRLITSDHLPYLAAMLESERNTSMGDDDPSRLIASMKVYMYSQKAEYAEDQKRNLYAAATLVRLWISSTVPLNINSPRTIATFRSLIQEILRTFLAPTAVLLFGRLPKTPSPPSLEGQISRYDTIKGFGFINGSMFFHKSAFLVDPTSVTVGAMITYSVGENRGKPCAINIRIVHGNVRHELSDINDLIVANMARELLKRLVHNLDDIPAIPTIKMTFGSWSMYEPCKYKSIHCYLY